jgi:hypothetical protein
MKKRLILFGMCGIAVLLLGAVAIETMEIQSRTVSSWGDLVDCYYIARQELPPLPLATKDTVEKIKAGDWSFLADHWQIRQSGGIYYVAEKSKLASGLKLPLTVRIFEDIRLREVIVMSSADGTNFQGEAIFAPPAAILTEASNLEVSGKDFTSTLTAEEKLNDSFWELSARRVVWEITLKSEKEAWSDLLKAEEASSILASALDGGGMMLRMSVPEENTNDLWLCLEAQTNGVIDLLVYAPEAFTNRVEIYSCSDLISGVWSIAQQNLYPSGTNPAVWDVTSDISNRFFRAGNMDIDSDGDGLPDAREQIVYRSNPASTDTDGDGLNDGAEVQTYGTNPASSDTDNDGMPDGWEITHGLNPLADDGLEDPDGDLFSNLHEYLSETNPHSNMSEVETLIFDEDTSNLEGLSYVSVITNANVSWNGDKCLAFTLTNRWNYYPRLDFESVSFGNGDTYEFYIRTASGINTNVLRLRVYFSLSSEMSYSVDIRPYLYDSNGVSAPGSITETYKKVSLPWDVLKQGGSNTVGTIRHMRLEILTNEVPPYVFPQTFYVDCISLQDKSGAVAENLEVLSDHYLEITSDNQLDEISLRNPDNHTVTRQSDGSPVAVTDIGLRSWVTDFNGSPSSPVVKHYIYVKLAESLANGETYIYSNSVQDISGNYPSASAVTFTLTNTVPTSSIKVNQVGWLPEAKKIAYVGSYLGDLGAMPLDTNVVHAATIRDADTGEAVYSTQLVKAVESDWINIGNTNSPFMIPFSGEETWRLDFTPLTGSRSVRISMPIRIITA